MTLRYVRKSTINTIVLVTLLCMIIIHSAFIPTGVSLAVENTYTGVLDDLNENSGFNISDYPAVADDYSLGVIQIAEGTGKELFVYVYQPCNVAKPLNATSIRMATDIDNPRYADYSLTFVNSETVMAKYKVNNFAVKDASTRYYEIVSIFRAWDKNMDPPSSSGNKISYVTFPVKQLWTVKTTADGITYDKTETKVIEVEDKFVGFVRYADGEGFFHSDKCDSHFVAFSTDIDIDQLFEADLSFTAKNYKKNIVEIEYMSSEDKYVTVTYKEKASNFGGLFAKKYVWDRIQSVDDFIKNENLNDDAIANLSRMQWVLRFYETKYTVPVGVGTGILGGAAVSTIKHLMADSTGTAVMDVSILRLNFESKGKVYNIGVIDNKQTENSKPVNKPELDFDLDLGWSSVGKRIFIIIAIVLAVVLLSVFAPLLTTIFKFVGNIIAIPFKAVNSGFKQLRRKRKDREEGDDGDE